MSTPIEIVREFQRWRRGQGKYGSYQEPMATIPWGPKVIGEALDAVLLDAERYKALELAHDCPDSRTGGPSYITVYVGSRSPEGANPYVWRPCDGTLAELADRLREGTK